MQTRKLTHPAQYSVWGAKSGTRCEEKRERGESVCRLHDLSACLPEQNTGSLPKRFSLPQSQIAAFTVKIIRRNEGGSIRKKEQPREGVNNDPSVSLSIHLAPETWCCMEKVDNSFFYLQERGR